MENIHKEILGLMGKIDIDCRNEGDAIVFDLAGQLDIYNSGEVQKLIDAYISRGFGKFVLNLEKVSYLDSSTISVFISGHQRLKKMGGKFLLARLTGAPREVFEMAKLHDVFEVHADVPSAVKSLLP
ncbi:MAG: STAS domain-containing protein [Nitrospinae bacterium]|nr:STAS domain-containing protein [Nitrospinota bacterium]